MCHLKLSLKSIINAKDNKAFIIIIIIIIIIVVVVVIAEQKGCVLT